MKIPDERSRDEQHDAFIQQRLDKFLEEMERIASQLNEQEPFDMLVTQEALILARELDWVPYWEIDYNSGSRKTILTYIAFCREAPGIHSIYKEMVKYAQKDFPIIRRRWDDYIHAIKNKEDRETDTQTA